MAAPGHLRRRHALLTTLVLAAAGSGSKIPAPDALQAAFSRLGAQSIGSVIPAAELPAFLSLAAGVDATHPPGAHTDEMVGALQQQLAATLGDGPYSIADILRAARALPFDETAPPSDAHAVRRCARPRTPRAHAAEPARRRARARSLPAPGACRSQATPEAGSAQLQRLRERLSRNRVTMPMFDTKAWVRDFEKSLKAQWEIYASGLLPMHVVVARSDTIFGAAAFDREVPGGA